MNIYKVTSQLNPLTPLIPLNTDNIQYIILHHPESQNCTWQDINEWHKQNGWNCAGYNEFITKSGDVYIMRDLNVGAQCLNYNSVSYGICCEGNYDVETTMPDAQKQSLIERIKFNKPRFPNYKFTAPHKQFCDTKCPGQFFPMAEILKRIEVIKVSTDEALKILQDNGVINSPDYWVKTLDTVKNQDQLFINFATKIQQLLNK